MRVTADNSRCSQLRRWSCLLALALFPLQLVRFYVAVPLDDDACIAAHNTHSAAGEQNRHSGHEAASPAEDGRNYFQHCKDELMALSSIPIFGALLQQWREDESVHWIGFVKFTPLWNDSDLPPPFEPPRTSL